LAVQAVVETYVSSIAHSASDFGFLTLVPWSSQDKPANVLAPGAGRGGVSSNSIARMVEQHEAVVIPSVYRTKAEKKALTRLLDYLGIAHPNAFIFLVQLPDQLDTELTKDYLRTLMARQDALYGFGASGVLIELEVDPEGLQHKIRMDLKVNAAIQLRMPFFESNLSGVLSSSECQLIEDRHDRLLWETIPQLLMPGFPTLSDRLLEKGNRVGEFRLLRTYTNHQHVFLAVNGQHENVVIKVHDKRSITDAKDVEGVYQELHLLKHTLDHPHITRCVNILHSQCCVYLVLQYGGDVSMDQVLSTKPGYRLSRDDALDCSTQVASALSYCHANDYVHGQVSLRHVSVEIAWNRHICRLVDFSMAAHVPDSGTLKNLRGSLPCVAPETALDEPYMPKPADCWSLGVVFLETACGLGSLELSVRWRSGVPLAQAAWQILEFFAQTGCHAEAMMKMGSAQDDTTLACLEALLKPNPLGRATASDAVGMFGTGHA